MGETWKRAFCIISVSAVFLFSMVRLLELNDSSYADVNAMATYRLACYYVMPNNNFKQDLDKGKRLLLRSKEWAIMSGDNKLLESIEKGLKEIERINTYE